MIQLQGALANNMSSNDALQKSRLPSDEDSKDGKFLNDMINQGLSSFQPDMALQNMVQNFKSAKNIYGESFLQEATGYASSSVERNIKLPEFAKDLKSRMHAKATELQEKGLLNEKGEILQKGMLYAALQLYTTELDAIRPIGTMGDHQNKEKAQYGTRAETQMYKHGDRFKDLDVKQSAKVALRRGHKKIAPSDLRVSQRESKGEVCIVYALDASGSMRGSKIEVAKRAGVALAYKATARNDKVGVMVFSHEVKTQVEPTTDFFAILSAMSIITASKQTDLAMTIRKSVELFPAKKSTKHLILITDAQTTVGDNPLKLALEAAGEANSAGITISMIGIKLDAQTAQFARELVGLANGKLYLVSNAQEIDAVVLSDYDSVAFKE